MQTVHKLYRSTLRIKHTAGLFSGSKEERKEKRAQRKQEIWSEINRGYFADFHEFRKTGGKRYEASMQLCSKEEAAVFPRISAQTLSGDKLELPQQLRGHVSLVLVSLRAMGINVYEAYRQPFLKALGGLPGVVVWEVSLVETMLYRVLSKWLEKNLRQQLTKNRHERFVLCTSETCRIKKGLEVGNNITGHVYLVDKEGLIRWRAHAKPTDREVKAMVDCARQLL